MASARPTPHEMELVEELQSFYLDPVGFVYFAYPWGEGVLKGRKPRTWQLNRLERLAEHLVENAREEFPRMFRHATVSGRGIGKSALVAWLSHWMMSTRIGGSVVLTANTEPQLKSRTVPEVKKWFSLGVNSHWWDTTALSVRPHPWLQELVLSQLGIDSSYYYLQAQLWSEEKPDAFAGLHNPHGVMLIMDEASGIPRPIFDVSEGFFTETTLDRFWFCFSNGRRLEGPFYDLFHGAYGTGWDLGQVDSREVEDVDQRLFEELIARHGEDSNVVRVEIKGQFPRAEDDKVIPRHLAEGAVYRQIEEDPQAPMIWGLDVARMGDDATALVKRRTHVVRPVIEWRGLDTMETVGRVQQEYDTTPAADRPEAIFVDSIGIGAGVVDRLRELGLPAVGINVSESPAMKDRYLNLRAELWFTVKEWLQTREAKLPDDPLLIAELSSPGYEFTSAGKLKVESKDHMKKRGVASPNRADALCLTFARGAAVALRGSRFGRRKTKRSLRRIA